MGVWWGAGGSSISAIAVVDGWAKVSRFGSRVVSRQRLIKVVLIGVTCHLECEEREISQECSLLEVLPSHLHPTASCQQSAHPSLLDFQIESMRREAYSSSSSNPPRSHGRYFSILSVCCLLNSSRSATNSRLISIPSSILKGHPSTESTIRSHTSVGRRQSLGHTFRTASAHQSRR